MQESESKAEAPKEEEAAPAAAPGESSFPSHPSPLHLPSSIPIELELTFVLSSVVFSFFPSLSQLPPPRNRRTLLRFFSLLACPFSFLSLVPFTFSTPLHNLFSSASAALSTHFFHYTIQPYLDSVRYKRSIYPCFLFSLVSVRYALKGLMMRFLIETLRSGGRRRRD
ncbi:hypothetical protein BDY24DRAFT_126947 [Mrakia frigida]|uniref:uncharacterized protein n=1 Tax=Mrakia frigida TaxID=29902 RepID=UPI003FCC0D85